jgi:hypothetical protein
MTAFDDLDPIELTLGKPVTAMTDTELVSYLKVAVRYYQGIELAVEGTRERAVMAGLKRTYGPDAGPLVKWAMWRHGGKFRNEIINHFAFTKGRKWFTDKLHIELQEHRNAERARAAAAARASAGFATGADL